MPHAIKRLLLSLMALSIVTALAMPGHAAGTVIKVSLWGDITGDMPTNMGMGVGKDKGATSGSKPGMGITIVPNSVKAGAETFEVKNNSKETIHEMLVMPIRDTSTPLPYVGNENRLDENAIKSLGEVSELDPGKSGTLTLDLTPGKYLLACNVPGHYMAGMWTVLTITP
jgi:uncharacterized cupredoxin-like copper-binding protein